MDKIIIRGGTPLEGKIHIGGAKNAALPLMTTALLSDEPVILTNIPNLADIECLIELLAQHGTRVERNGSELKLHASTITSVIAPYDIVRKMRASILVLGPLMARAHEAIVSLPGGCAIGTRPVDLHIKGLQAMGAEIDIREGYIHAKAPGGLKGANFNFPIVSVTGTENLLMAACLAKGYTRLINVAKEPEVCDLANCLVAMGAKISGIGTTVLEIEGVDRLSGVTHQVLPDRIETGTYAIAAAITGGKLDLVGTNIELLPTFVETLRESGIQIKSIPDGIRIEGSKDRCRSVNMETQPFPGFSTDLQAQFMALMTLGQGTSIIHETIFENRFMHVSELSRMGADITVEGSRAMVKGIVRLKGAPVMATDLRASVSLVLAGLAAEGETIVNRVYHLDRGYESLEAKLSACGANIRRAAEGEEIHPSLKTIAQDT